MADKVTFPCGSSGHPEYCPSQCSFGRFCKFLKTQSVKPRGMAQTNNPNQIAADQQKKQPEPQSNAKFEPYY